MGLAISIGSGLTSLVLSWWTTMPVVTAWSTPGAALLVTSIGAYRYSHVIGTFVVVALVMTVIGLSGVFGRLVGKIPAGIQSAMLAGILLPFVLHAFAQVGVAPVLTVLVFVAFLLAKRYLPRYAVLVALVVGVVVAAGQSRLSGLSAVRWSLTTPIFTMPTFSVAALMGIGVPLLVVTMASQNAPGLAVMRASGYEPDDRRLLGGTGIASLVLAPFGSHAVNLAAITAAICTGPEAHENPRRRYVAGMAVGVFYLVLGSFGMGLVQLSEALPKELVAIVAGLALTGAVLSGLIGAIDDVPHREAALITLSVTASGLTVLGVGSAFWGLVGGVVTYGVLKAPALRRAR